MYVCFIGWDKSLSANAAWCEQCIQELQDYSRMEASIRVTPAIDSHAVVYKSDTLVPESLRKNLIAAAAPLEAVPEKHKDWHPGSDGKVLDLVHPSLYPLIYGRSLALKHGTVPLKTCAEYIGKGEIGQRPNDEDLLNNEPPEYSWSPPELRKLYSGEFQWLPSEVVFGDGNTVNITSYVNNLHPSIHGQLYGCIENIIAKAMPMWEMTLQSTTEADKGPRIKIEHIPSYSLPEGQQRPKELNEDERDEDEDDDFDIDELDHEWLMEHGIIEPPKCPEYTGRAPKIVDGRLKGQNGSADINLRRDFAQEGLQVIVKLANIHLTPDKPTYDGGSWHVEGLLNEHICATALYYYDSENVVDSFLAFRENVDSDYVEQLPYEQSRYDHLEKLFDVRWCGPAIQHLGHVRTCQGRLLTFPNVLHHRVEPFSLADKSRSGHRKILALFLVDPYMRIPSTANVPPQQKEWWAEHVRAASVEAGLPIEVADHIIDDVDDFPIGLDEAKRLRLALMKERSVTQVMMEEKFTEENHFNFCEH
jgi:hypothetical protein